MCGRLEDKALDLDWNLETRLSRLLWQIGNKIEINYTKLEIRCGYQYTQKPMVPWLKNCLMTYCDLSEEDVKKCSDYFNKY